MQILIFILVLSDAATIAIGNSIARNTETTVKAVVFLCPEPMDLLRCSHIN